MLTHIYAACAREHKLLREALLRKCSADNLSTNVPTCMAMITDGLCRPFRMRVEQALAAENGPVVLHRLHATCTHYSTALAYAQPLLICRYRIFFSEHLTGEANLLTAVVEVRTTAQHMFNTSLNSHVQRTLTRVHFTSIHAFTSHEIADW